MRRIAYARVASVLPTRPNKNRCGPTKNILLMFDAWALNKTLNFFATTFAVTNVLYSSCSGRSNSKIRTSYINVYLVCSHMWGTCNKHSDWDIVIIVHTLDLPKPINTHKGIIEAFILSREQFIQSITDHLMQVLLLLWLPKECIWLERFNSKSSFKFNHATLIKSLEHSQDRDIRIAEKHYMKGDLHKAKKILLHCMRYLELGLRYGRMGM